MTIFTVEGHRLLADGVPVTFRRSPNVGGAITAHRLLVQHFTSDRYDGAVSWLGAPVAKVSAHVVIGEAGEVTQLVPFDRVAWHAGVSSWRDVTHSVNGVSIGIEIANYGDMIEGAPGAWHVGARRIPDDRVLVARHKAGGPPRPWHTYTARQIETVIAVSQALQAAYRFEDVVGHEDVAPGRKVDPGPAFDMAAVRAAVLGDVAPPAAAHGEPTVALQPAPDHTPIGLQRALNHLGFGPLAEDGDIGPATKRATAEFQRGHDLDDDGIAGPKTWRALDAALA